MIDLLLKRRSTLARDMQEPGPSKADLRQILQAGLRVPDHGKLAPWAFHVFTGAARDRLGAIFAQSIAKEKPDSSEPTLQRLRNLPLDAPVVIAVISAPVLEHKVPVWEQQLSAGAACQNMLIAADALGYAGQWITGMPAYSEGVAKFFGLGDGAQIAGFLYLGSRPEVAPQERLRPDFDAHVCWADETG